MKLHIEVILDLYSSSNNFWLTRTRRVKLAGHVAGMEEGLYQDCSKNRRIESIW